MYGSGTGRKSEYTLWEPDRLARGKLVSEPPNRRERAVTQPLNCEARHAEQLNQKAMGGPETGDYAIVPATYCDALAIKF